MINLRLRAPSGVATIQLPGDATRAQLEASISSATGIAATELDIRLGFPRPAPLPASRADSTLTSLGIRSGETLQVSQRPPGSLPPAAVTATPSASRTFASTGTGPVPAAPSKSQLTPSSPVLDTPSRRPTTSAPLSNPLTLTQRSAPSLKNVSASVQTEAGWLVLRVAPDDNSCMFHAAGLVLEHGGGEDVAAKLRGVVAGAVRADPERWCEPVLGSEPTTYIRQITSKNTWGGAIELAILSEHYRTEICSIDVQTCRMDRFGEAANYPNRILLVYSGIHYDSLTLSPIDPDDLPPPSSFPPEIGFDTTIFPTSDESILDAAVRLVSKLKALHYYTDTATFTLKCEICGDGLTGEKEARQHAERTGHTSFGEY